MAYIRYVVRVVYSVGTSIFPLSAGDHQASNPYDSQGLPSRRSRSSHSRLALREHTTPLESNPPLPNFLTTINLNGPNSTR
ncbi:hypothetical protein FRC12_024439 [Ceratobasidium sp. 428]|nr:hypothetical protein FRC12_024439 [Ceratobasidium sp. 428]